MAYRGPEDVKLFMVDGFDLLSSLTEFTDKWAGVFENTKAPFGEAWDTHAWVGVRQAEITQQGYYDDGVGSAHEALSTGPGVSRILCYGVEGTATGANFVGYRGALQIDYERGPRRAELHKANAAYKGSGRVEQGKVLRFHNVATASGASTGTPFDAGASSTGYAAYLQVSRLDNASTLTVTVRHSSDNVTYANLVAFTANTSGTVPDAEVKQATAVVERYRAVKTDFSSAGVNASAKFFVGLVSPLVPGA